MTVVEPNQPRRKRLTAAQREQQILDVAEGLFAERGIEGVSLEEIAKAAGVSRPIVYQYHGSRDGVFLACARRARGEFDEAMRIALQRSGPDLTERIAAGGDPYFDLIKRNPHRWALVFAASASLNAEIAQELAFLRTRTTDRIADAVGETAPGLGVEQAQALAYAISGIAEQLGRWWIRNPRVPKKRVLEYYRTFVLGAATAGLEVFGPEPA